MSENAVSPVLDLVAAWRRRGRQVPGTGLEESTLAARARVRGEQLVVAVFDLDMEPLGQLVFTPARAREWGRYLTGFANKCSQADARKDRVAAGLCDSLGCKRKLVVGTERCRRCGAEIAAREITR